MQPMIAVTSSESGILYLNGHFAGETDAEHPLLRPVSPRGALVLEYRPYADDVLPMTRRLVFSGGMPLRESAEEMTGADIVVWPGNVVEIELTPRRLRDHVHRFSAEGHTFSMENDRLFRDGEDLCALPEGAEIPEAVGGALIGSCKTGKYLLTFDAGFLRQTGALTAKEIRIEGDAVHAILDRGDLVGHGTLEIWRRSADGLAPVSSESVWIDGSPRWPQSPAETARAFVEACLAGLDGEAEGYLSPALRQTFSGEAIRAACDLCVEMKYAPPNARPSIGLLKLIGGNLARVEAMTYSVIASSGVQGAYKLVEIIMPKNTQEFNVTIP